MKTCKLKYINWYNFIIKINLIVRPLYIKSLRTYREPLNRHKRFPTIIKT